MRRHAVHDRFIFPVTLDQLCPDDRVRTFHFVTDGLADVVQQAGAFGELNVHAQFGGHQAHQLGNLDGMV